MQMLGKASACILSVAMVVCSSCARIGLNPVQGWGLRTEPALPAPEPTDTDIMLESARHSFVNGIRQYKQGQYELAREYLSQAIEQVVAADFLDPTVFDNRLKIYDNTEVPLSPENGDVVEDTVFAQPSPAGQQPEQPEQPEQTPLVDGIDGWVDEFPIDGYPLPEPVEPEVTYDLPVVINKYVEKQIEFFQKNKRSFQEAIDRSGKYLPMIKATMRHEGLPEDLAYLAMVESYFKPKARSHVGAAGLWQFMPRTAEKHGLEIDFYVDERYNVEKATYAAISYLSGLNELFKGDWLMAMAAYNMGEGGLLLRAALSAGTQDFWKLLEINPSRKYLPTETKNFVPRILAAVVISKQPEKYGFSPSKLQPEPTDQIAIKGSLPLDTLARICEVDVDALRTLNPELRRSVTPPQREPYILTIPAGTRSILEEALAKLPVENGVHSFTYKVRSGDTLGRLASQHGTTVEDIMAHNGLRNHIIRIGQTLVIPAAGSGGPRMTADGVLAAGSSETIHIVEPGDTLWEIAREYGTTVARLSEINGLHGSQARKLRLGQKIVVYPEPTLLARETSGRTTSYTVRKGDSLWSIARKHGVAVDDIMRWNSLRSRTIHPGDRLAIGGSR